MSRTEHESRSPPFPLRSRVAFIVCMPFSLMQWGHVSCISSSTCSMEACAEGCHSLCRGVIPPGWKPKKTTSWLLKAALPCADGVFPELGVMASRLSDAVYGSSNEEFAVLDVKLLCCHWVAGYVLQSLHCFALQRNT